MLRDGVVIVVDQGVMVAAVEAASVGNGFRDWSHTGELEAQTVESQRKELLEPDIYSLSGLAAGDPHELAVWSAEPPESEAAWAACTESRLKSARELRHIAEVQLANSHRKAVQGNQRKAEATKSYQITVKKRMDKMEAMIRSLMDHVQSLDGAIHEVGSSSFHLQRADSACANQLDVAQRRSELRQKRPPREIVLDTFGKALGEEQQILRSMRACLAVEIDNCRQLLAQCEETREAALTDVRNKRHAMRLERVVWRGPDVVAATTKERNPLATTKERNPLKRMDTLVGITNTQTKNWEAESTQLVNKACNLVAQVNKLAEAQKDLLNRALAECERTQKQTAECMKKRLAELTDFRKAIDGEVVDIDGCIIHVQECLDETKRQCDLYKVPLQELDEANAIRKQRIDGENIRDSVRFAEGETVEVLTTIQYQLQEQHSQQSDTLQQMQLKREELWQDLQDKVAALNIDIVASRICIRPKSGHNVGTPNPPPQRIKKDHFRRKHMDWSQNRPSSARNATSGARQELDWVHHKPSSQDPGARAASPEKKKTLTETRPTSARQSNATTRKAWNW